MSTYLSLHYHIIFSTKDREPWFTPTTRSRIHEYLGGTVLGLKGFAHGIGGTSDHVHLLISLQATHCLANFIRELKKNSSVWIRDTCGLSGFAWQDGYCAFTVNPSSRPAVHKYIAEQEEHHRKRTFHQELLTLLNKASIEYDPRYLQ